jgi:hypothetical protein
VAALGDRRGPQQMIHSTEFYPYESLTPARTLCKLRLSHSGV